jgi:beta-mannosidase
MGTLLWQLNDCWPVTSWSITDYSREPKAAWYAVKEAYRDDVLPIKDSIIPKDLQLKKPTIIVKYIGDGNFTFQSDVDAKYVYISEEEGRLFSPTNNYFDLKAGEVKRVWMKHRYFTSAEVKYIKIISLYNVLNKK